MLIIQFVNGNTIQEECAPGLWQSYPHKGILKFFMRNEDLIEAVGRVLYVVQ